MGRKAKIVFIGGGSMCFGISVFRDLFTEPKLKGSTLALVDINEENLNRMTKLANKLNSASGMELKIESTMERREVLLGADFVINSIAIERCDLWKHDFQVPQKYGVRHTLGENGGPGALFFTLRTIPEIMNIAKDMEELCPDAYFLNFSNPESRIILALNKYTKIKAIGLCHGIIGGLERISEIMGMEQEQVNITAAGLNHIQFILSVRDKHTGEDLYPLFKEKEKTFDPTFSPLIRKVYRSFGYLPSPDDGHVGEFLSFGYEAGEEGYDFEDDARYRVYLANEIDGVINGETDPDIYLSSKSGEVIMDVITGILYDENKAIPSAIVYNNGAIPNLPNDCAVEVPIIVNRDGAKPIQIRDYPDQLARLFYREVSIQQMSVDAAVFASKEMALQTLLMEPVINSYDTALKILDELWEINKPYIFATK